MISFCCKLHDISPKAEGQNNVAAHKLESRVANISSLVLNYNVGLSTPNCMYVGFMSCHFAAIAT